MNKQIIVSLMSLVLTTFAIHVKGQYLDYRFDRYSVKDGLAQSAVNYIIQDKTGFLWFATYNGVSRFDGYEFKNFYHNPDNDNSLKSNATNYLLEDSKGYLWIISSGIVGIDRYNYITNEFQNFHHDPNDTTSLTSNNVFHINEDSNGDIWLSTDNGLNKLIDDNGKISFKRISYPVKGVSNYPYIYENKDKELFLLSDSKYILNRKTMTFSLIQDTLLNIHYFNSLTEDDEGNIFTVHNQKLIKIRYNPQYHSFELVESYPQTIPVDIKNTLIIDGEKNIWIGNESAGLFEYNLSDHRLEHFTYDEQDEYSISENSINSLFIDKTGVLWIGTFNKGLCKYDLFRKKFFQYKSIKDDTNSLSGNHITAIHSISNNELWVANKSDYAINRLIFDNDRLDRIIRYGHDPENQNSIGTNKISCLIQGRDGDVWIGGQNNILTRIIPEDPYSGEEPVIERYYIDSWTFSIYKDSEGTIWGGTWGGGLYRFYPSTKQVTYFKNSPDDEKSLIDNVVWSIYEDSDKNLWVGGNSKGLSILPADQKKSDNPEFINNTYNKENPSSISSNTINGFYQDTKGDMWIATTGGLNLVKNSNASLQEFNKNNELKFQVFNNQDGLAGNGIVGIMEDLENNLWISSTSGLSFFNLKDSTFTNYHESDGLQGDEFGRNAYHINSQGTVFLGGENGISAFNPQDIIANPYKPGIVFTDLKVFNKSVEIGEAINKDVLLTKDLNELKNIVFSHKNNFFTLDFAALHFNKPEQNQYAYYLEGFENDWNYTNERSATYTNLNAGKYIFHVKASNNNGIWNEKGKSIVIRVKAAWYNTWLFRIILLVFIGLGITYAMRRRMENIKREKELLQQRIEEGEKELQIKKDEIEKQQQEIEEQNRRDFELRYQHTGISNFAELFASNRQDLSELTNNLISALVEYTKTNSGVVYLVDDSDQENIKLIRTGAFCYDSETVNKHDFIPGEGYVGTCFKEKKTMHLNDLPEGYMSLSSALGKTSLKHSLLVPIINEERCLGVIELGSLSAIESYKTEFVAKLAENYASVIAISQANTKTQEMLEQNKLQSEELISQEEELRQNLEEMQATQEELKRQMEASKQANEKMTFEQTLTDSLLKNAPEKIYFKDLESRFIKASNSMQDIFRVKKVEEIYGKTDFDFFAEDHARQAFEDEQKIIKTGKPIFDKIEKETHADGRITYANTTKLPLKNPEGEIIGTFGISKDITELMELKEALDKREDEISDKEKQIIKLQDLIKQKETAIIELENKLKKNREM